MKRILSILILLILLISSLTTYAIDAGTYTQKLNSVGGYIWKVDASTMGNYGSTSLISCVLYFALPLPTLSSNQTLADCKLYFYTTKNSLATGYNLGAFKLDNGAQLIKDATALGGADNKKAVKKFYDRYSVNGIHDALIYNEIGNDTNPKMVKLTSYFHEIENDNNGYMYIAISVLTSNSIAIDMSKPVNFEYTVVDKAKVSGYGVYDVKLTPEMCDYYNANSETTLIADSPYKAVVKAFNYESVAKNAVLYIATYNDGELETLTPATVTLNPYDSDIMILSEAFTAPSAGKKVKAFLWDEDGMTPLTKGALAYTVSGE